jgi:hypothetical protein
MALDFKFQLTTVVLLRVGGAVAVFYGLRIQFYRAVRGTLACCSAAQVGPSSNRAMRNRL